MDKSLRLQVLFAGIDKLSGPLKQVSTRAKGATKDLASTRKEITALKQAQAKAGALADLRKGLGDTHSKLDQVRKRIRQLGADMDATGNNSKQLARALAAAQREEAKLAGTAEKQSRSLNELQAELRGAGVDTANLARHQDKLAAELGQANSRLKKQQDHIERVNRAKARGEKIRGAGDGIAGAGVTSTVAVTAPLIAFAAASKSAALESRAASAQVEASLSSMGSKAGRTFDQLADHAARLQGTSLYDDDDIMKEMTANLLTFGRVSGKIFDRAQQAGVDMSAKLGQGLQSSAMQLGKALNDPVKGITALSRVGVSFTAEQKKMVAQLVKTNQVAKAQALILTEVERQFAGSAAAARSASPDAEFVDNWREFQETTGEIVLKVLPRLTAVLTKALSAFNKLTPAQQEMVIGAMGAAAAFGPLLIVLGNLVKGIGFLWPMLARLGPLFMTMKDGARAAGPVTRFFMMLGRGLLTLATKIFPLFRVALFALARGVMSAGAMMLANPIVLAIVALVAAIGLAAFLIWKHWDKIKAAFWAGVAAVGRAWETLKAVASGAISWWLGLHAKFAQIGANLVTGLINGFLGRVRALKSAIVGVAGNVRDWFAKKLGIHSPSRVFMGLGGFLTDGLAIGVAKGAAAPLERIRQLAGRMGAAMALGASSAALAAPGTVPLVGGISRAAAAPTSAGAGAAPAMPPIEIHIHQLPGQSGPDLAAAVRRELEAFFRRGGGGAGGSYEDD